MVRIVQHNDWVVFIIIGCILLYIFMLLYLQRDSSVRVFMLQKYADSSNNFLSWLLVSVVFSLLLATLISQSIPVVPKEISDIHIFGYGLNKFGFTFLSVVFFYFFKSFLTYLFFAGTGSLRRLRYLQFTASKFYFALSFVVMILCVYQNYYQVDLFRLFNIYLIGFLAVFLFKIFVYFWSPLNILPEKWYYKFLYICTLQITPILLLWRVLYF